MSIQSQKGLDEYIKAIHDVGFTEHEIKEMSERTHDVITDPIDGISIKQSIIHGNGVFADKSFKNSEKIGAARIQNKRTLINRYTNHSDQPNALPIATESGVDLVAINDINQGDEITVDYRHSACAHSIANKTLFPTRKGEIAEKLLEALHVSEKEGNMIRVEDQLEHFHPDGLYGRKQTLKAGSFVVGKVHKRESLTILLYGKLVIVKEDGSREINVGPKIWITKPGTQRVIYAEADSEWIGVWPTQLKDVEQLEDELSCRTMQDFERLKLEHIHDWS